jgi:hypothetical protein
MSNYKSEPWAYKSNAELQDMIEDAQKRRTATVGHTRRQRLTERIEALQSTLDNREEDSVASGYADYLIDQYEER